MPKASGAASFPSPYLPSIYALAGSWWGPRLGRATKHKQRIRNEKLKVYLELDMLGLDPPRGMDRSPAPDKVGIPGARDPLLAFE